MPTTDTAASTRLQLVVVQPDIAWEDRPANHSMVRSMLGSSPPPANSLVVLPELFDTGFTMQVARLAPRGESDSERFMRTLAAEFRCAVLAGVMGPCHEGRATNEAVAFDPQGRELVRYRKMRPYTIGGEHESFHAGQRVSVFEWEGLTIAPFICYDLRFPELMRQAVREGAELLVQIANWPAVRSEHWVRLLQARSIENQAFAVGVNRCGTDPQAVYNGRSVVFDPQGRCLLELDALPQVAQLGLDSQAVQAWRTEFPVLRDLGIAEPY